MSTVGIMYNIKVACRSGCYFSSYNVIFLDTYMLLLNVTVLRHAFNLFNLSLFFNFC